MKPREINTAVKEESSRASGVPDRRGGIPERPQHSVFLNNDNGEAHDVHLYRWPGGENWNVGGKIGADKYDLFSDDFKGVDFLGLSVPTWIGNYRICGTKINYNAASGINQ